MLGRQNDRVESVIVGPGLDRSGFDSKSDVLEGGV
jgi:hypothetical protein